MTRYFIRLRSKIENIETKGSRGPTLGFYKIIFSLLKFTIVLTRGSGFSFPLIFQNRGSRSTTHSYRDFKSYQVKVRISFFILIFIVILALAVINM